MRRNQSFISDETNNDNEMLIGNRTGRYLRTFFLMYYYRLYSLDMSDAHIIDVRDFQAAGDPAAILMVGAPVSGVSRELWNLGRKVMDFAQ